MSLCSFSWPSTFRYLFSYFSLLNFFSVATLRRFNLLCMPLILHMLFVLILPRFLISFVLTLVLHSSNCGILCKNSRFPLPSRRAHWTLVAVGSTSATSAIHSSASFKKSSLWPLCSDWFFFAKLNKSSFCFSFYFFIVSDIFIKYLIKISPYCPKLN